MIARKHRAGRASRHCIITCRHKRATLLELNPSACVLAYHTSHVGRQYEANGFHGNSSLYTSVNGMLFQS